MNLQKELSRIQKELKAPKNQFNTFGNYKYRSQEDILEAVKPLLSDVILTVSDEMILLGDRYYIKATAKVSLGEESIEVNGYAREAETKKGMDLSQVTGASSSYARKYALNGLFLIDDTKDADATNKHDSEIDPQVKPTLTDIKFKAMKDAILKGEYLQVKSRMNNYQLTTEQEATLNELIAGAENG